MQFMQVWQYSYVRRNPLHSPLVRLGMHIYGSPDLAETDVDWPEICKTQCNVVVLLNIFPFCRRRGRSELHDARIRRMIGAIPETDPSFKMHLIPIQEPEANEDEKKVNRADARWG